MPGISDSNQPDDIRIHLDLILAADAARAEAEPGETEAEARVRQSLQLSFALRTRTQEAFERIREAAPGMSAAEVDKLSATRAARAALRAGREALARVDSHLAAVTNERSPTIARNYGVFGSNPTSFAGVFRALSQSEQENARIAALPDGNPERQYLFTPVIEDEVKNARAHLGAVLGERVTTRAELSRKVALQGDTVAEARACISAVRNHLYANLPGRKKDPDLRDYGFRPIFPRSVSSAEADEEGGDVEPDTEE